ncbi:MAG: MFS transporter [marine bacterium B5-7]|nr:MAG: MFS transporter [marine bacterium B5-7]
MTDTPTHTRLQAWLVVFFASLLFYYEFMQLNMINSLSTPLMREFHLNAEQLSALSSMYFIANVLFLLPAGIMLDRFSTRKLILGAMTICTLSIFGFALSHSVILSGFFRFATGIGGAFCFLSCMRIASRWFPPHRMALVTGFVVTMAMLGGWTAQMPLTHLIHDMGWRDALLVDGVLGVLITVFMLFVLKDRPDNQADDTSHEVRQLQEIGLLNSVKLVLSNWQNWLGGLYTCFLNLPIFLLGALWGTHYLMQIDNLSAIQASSISGMIFVGATIGSPVMGWLSDKMRRRCLPMMIGAVLSLSLIFIIIYQEGLSYATLQVLFFALGFITSTQVISYPTVAEHNSPLLTGTAVSIVSMTTLAGGAIFQPFFGWLMDKAWSGKVIHGVPVYSVTDYRTALTILPIVFGLALIAAILLRETYCRSQTE